MATEDIPPVLSDVRKRAGLRVIQEFPTESKWTKGQRVSWGGYGSFRRLIPGSSRKAFSGRFGGKQSKCSFGVNSRGAPAPRLAWGGIGKTILPCTNFKLQDSEVCPWPITIGHSRENEEARRPLLKASSPQQPLLRSRLALSQRRLGYFTGCFRGSEDGLSSS